MEHSSSVLDLSHPTLLAPRALFTISTPWRAPSQVGIVARSLAASGGALHLPGASTRVGAAKPWASVAPASRCKLPTPCAPHAAPRVRSTSSPRHRGRYSRTEPRPCAARGVALVRAGSEGARCGLLDALTLACTLCLRRASSTRNSRVAFCRSFGSALLQVHSTLVVAPRSS